MENQLEKENDMLRQALVNLGLKYDNLEKDYKKLDKVPRDCKEMEETIAELEEDNDEMRKQLRDIERILQF